MIGQLGYGALRGILKTTRFPGLLRTHRTGMSPSMAGRESDAVGRAFAATLYLLGRRGSELEVAGLAPAPFVARLKAPDRTTRARALAEEIAAIDRALAACAVGADVER